MREPAEQHHLGHRDRQLRPRLLRDDADPLGKITNPSALHRRAVGQNHASQQSNLLRIPDAWVASVHLADMNSSNPSPSATMKAGSMLISVWYDGDGQQPDGGVRRRYGYRIEDLEEPIEPHVGFDLHSAAGAEIDILVALRTLVSFLGAAGESYPNHMRDPGRSSDDMSLFPLWVAESAYRNADEMAILGRDEDDQAVADASPTRDARWLAGESRQRDDTAEVLPALDANVAVDHPERLDRGAEDPYRIDGQDRSPWRAPTRPSGSDLSASRRRPGAQIQFLRLNP